MLGLTDEPERQQRRLPASDAGMLGRLRALGQRLTPALALTLGVTGCGERIQESFEVACVTFGRPDAPEGALLRLRHGANGKWTVEADRFLPHAAVLLFPAPYPEQSIQFLTVSGVQDSKSSALWEMELQADAAPRHLSSFPGRVVLLFGNNASADAAVLVFVAADQAEITRREFGRQAVSLRTNARCSVAVWRYAAPDSLQVIDRCRYARPGWLSERRFAYLAPGGALIAAHLDSADVDTLAYGLEAFSTAPAAGRWAAGWEGDSVAVFTADGQSVSLPLRGASLPALAPDGAWLAYHAPDHGIWIRELAGGRAHELGIGYPIAWSGDSRLLLFYERRLDKRQMARSIFHVGAPSGAVATLPGRGIAIDAVLVP